METIASHVLAIGVVILDNLLVIEYECGLIQVAVPASVLYLLYAFGAHYGLL